MSVCFADVRECVRLIFPLFSKSLFLFSWMLFYTEFVAFSFSLSFFLAFSLSPHLRLLLFCWGASIRITATNAIVNHVNKSYCIIIPTLRPIAIHFIFSAATTTKLERKSNEIWMVDEFIMGYKSIKMIHLSSWISNRLAKSINYKNSKLSYRSVAVRQEICSAINPTWNRNRIWFQHLIWLS